MNDPKQLSLIDDDFGKSSKVIKSVRWQFTDHCCRHCYGRVMKRRISPYHTVVKCAKCEKEVVGNEFSLCCCGEVVGDKGNVWECVKNPNITPEIPNAILVRERKKES